MTGQSLHPTGPFGGFSPPPPFPHLQTRVDVPTSRPTRPGVRLPRQRHEGSPPGPPPNTTEAKIISAHPHAPRPPGRTRRASKRPCRGHESGEGGSSHPPHRTPTRPCRQRSRVQAGGGPTHDPTRGAGTRQAAGGSPLHRNRHGERRHPYTPKSTPAGGSERHDGACMACGGWGQRAAGRPPGPSTSTAVVVEARTWRHAAAGRPQTSDEVQSVGA